MTAIIAVVEKDAVYLCADTQQTAGDTPTRGSKLVFRNGWLFAWAGSSAVSSWLEHEPHLPLTGQGLASSKAYELAGRFAEWKAGKESRDCNLLAVSPEGRVFEIFDGTISERDTGDIITYGAPLSTLCAYNAVRLASPYSAPYDAIYQAIEAVCQSSVFCSLPLERHIVERK